MSDSPPPPAARGLGGAMMRGTAWSLVMRWSVRLLGLLNTAVLARLLLPADFGLVATAMIVVGISESLLNFGADFAILRDKHADRHDFDTAWTLRIFQSAAVALVVCIGSFFAGDFFGDPRVQPIIQIGAVCVLVRGFENIGITLFRKQFRFDQDFYFNVSSKVASVVVTIALALYFRTYWALIFGILAAAVLQTMLSYVLSPYRPAFSIRRIRQILSFSQWILVIGVSNFLRNDGDRFVIARLASAANLGVYSIAKDIAFMVTQEITGPIAMALFPAIAEMTDDRPRLAAAFLLSLSGALMVATPACAGMALVANEFVPVLLGAGWDAAIPLVQILALAGGLQVYLGICYQLLLVLNRGSIVATLTWTESVLAIAGISVGYIHWGIVGGVSLMLCASMATATLASAVLVVQRAVSAGGLVRSLWRPLVAATAMAAVVLTVAGALPTEMPGPVVLAVKVLAGGLAYAIALISLWVIEGQPDGLERRALDIVRDRAKRIAAN